MFPIFDNINLNLTRHNQILMYRIHILIQICFPDYSNILYILCSPEGDLLPVGQHIFEHLSRAFTKHATLRKRDARLSKYAFVLQTYIHMYR